MPRQPLNLLHQEDVGRLRHRDRQYAADKEQGQDRVLLNKLARKKFYDLGIRNLCSIANERHTIAVSKRLDDLRISGEIHFHEDFADQLLVPFLNLMLKGLGELARRDISLGDKHLTQLAARACVETRFYSRMLNHLSLDLPQALGGGLDAFVNGEPPIKSGDLKNLLHGLAGIDESALAGAIRRLIHDPQQQLEPSRVDQCQMLQVQDDVAHAGVEAVLAGSAEGVGRIGGQFATDRQHGDGIVVFVADFHAASSRGRAVSSCRARCSRTKRS